MNRFNFAVTCGIGIVCMCCKDDPAPPPTVDFTATKTEVVKDESVTFSDQSTGEPGTWLWTFDGGVPSTSTEKNPVVIYPTEGVYNVSLVVNGPGGTGNLTKPNFIKVIPPPGVVDFSVSDTEVNQNQSLTFSDESSGSTPVSWMWTFKGGVPSTSTEENPVINYPKQGTFDVSVVVTFEGGDVQSTKEDLITVNPPEGIVYEYPLDGNANDISGNNNPGSVDGATAEEDRFLTEGHSMHFDGNDDLISFPYDTRISSFPATFSYWIRFHQLKSVVLGSNVADDVASGFYFSVGQETETLNKLAMNFGSGMPPSPEARLTFVSDNVLDVDQWYHVVGVFENVSTLRLYIDGVETAGFYTGSATETNYVVDAPGVLGRVWNTATRFYGDLDDFRIYDRVLPLTEIQSIFAEEK